ncbi:hypothetical protein PFISCL1PPCAC_23623 [Pristionchus fissidentatus]|uniref:Uncharacterized protein n=1 Tax=Pristionchus fissidentatus TaxID=1538716 RepID=A0AAV5WJ74_9BILA|nr:hypothetical protein PFISCL1PPCAC_23623 [Pristionchus fissidentatus]
MGRTKRSRWEQNEISPSKYRSPTRYDKSDTYPDKDEVCWKKQGSGLSNEQIEVYFRCTTHLHRDISLGILQDHDHDIPSAVAACNAVESVPDLSLLEEKVLLAAAPVPITYLGIKSRSAAQAEQHICSLLPHIEKSAIRNYYNKIGRDGYVPPRGWVPRVGHLVMPAADRLIRAECFTIDEDSPLYEKPGKRVLRSSSTITPEINEMPRKVGKRNNLAIAMVGYDQTKAGQGDSSPEGRMSRTLPFNRNLSRSTSIESRISSDRKSRGAQPRRMDKQTHQSNGVSKTKDQSPLSPSPLSSGGTSPPLIPSSTSSSVNSTPEGPKKRRNTLDIDMNWSPIQNGFRMRRPSIAMSENGDIPFHRKQSRDQDLTTNRHDAPSTSRLSGGAERKRRVREPSIAASDRHMRSSSVFGYSLTPQEESTVNTCQTRKLHIAMVGWGQTSPGSKDKDGFAVPNLPLTRSAHKSPTRSTRPSLSPPASPEI